jgi:uncharacterized protein YndB with AHSA1/START domain
MNEQIHISAQIAAPKGQVWTKYTDPLHIVNWNFANPDWCCPSAKNDLCVDGMYDVRMEAKDGSFGFDFRAVYTELEIEKSFTYRMEDGRMCTVEFTETDGETKIDVHFDPENINPIEMQQAGWQAILNNFKVYVEIGYDE